MRNIKRSLGKSSIGDELIFPIRVFQLEVVSVVRKMVCEKMKDCCG